MAYSMSALCMQGGRLNSDAKMNVTIPKSQETKFRFQVKCMFRWAICSNSVLAIMFMKELSKILADKNYIVKLRYSLFVLIK